MRDKERTEELVVVDISRYKKVKTALKESEARYRLLFENISLGVFRITADGKIIDANPALLKMLGYSSFSELEHRQPEKNNNNFLKTWLELCNQIDGQSAIGSFDQTWRKTDNTPLFIHVNARVISESGGKVLFYEGTIEDISERKRAESQKEDALEALQNALAGKEVLLKEIQHRVKNNLAAIIGLLQLQSETMTDPAAVVQFRELEGRIRSMALVHETLYHIESLARIDLQKYLEKLVTQLRAALDPRGDIRFSVAAAGVEMGLDIAIPCGLILNELITNAFKYAFPGNQPRPGEKTCAITISAAWDSGAGDGGVYTLTVADNGVGLPVDLDWLVTKTLGLRLVRMLGQYQLKGQIELDRANGTSFRMVFTSRQN